MGALADALKKLQENSDDLSSLPQIVAQVEAMEGKDFEYQERIANLQEINRKYLAQIPLPGQTPTEPTTPEQAEPTLEDARQHIINTLNGGN